MRTRRQLHGAWIGLLAFAIFANALPNDFVYDDYSLVRFNPSLDDSTRLGSFFTGDLWSRLGHEATNYYRPLPPLILAAVHAVAGETPWAFRLLNLLFHAMASVLVLRLLLDLGGGRPGESAPQVERAALAGAALFAVHPVHVEAVAWISGVMDVACAAFVLLSFDLYRRAERSPRRRLLTSLGVAAFLLALLTKEPAAVLPLVLVLYEALRSRPTSVPVRQALTRTAPWFVVLALYLGLRALSLGGLAPLTRPRLPSLDSALLLLADVFARYVKALFLPFDLSLGHAAARPESWTSVRGATALVVLAATALFAWATWRRNRGALFGLALFVVALAPALYLPGLVMPLEKLFAERFLYLPSVGWAVAAAMVIRSLARRAGRRERLVWLAATALVVMFGSLTLRQNRVWRSELAVWEDATAKFPDFGMNHLDYGNALLGAGQGAAARRAFERAAELDPAVIDLLVHQGRLRLAAGRARDALLKFEQALALAPKSFDALLGAADAANAADWHELAASRYQVAIALRPDSAPARNGYGYLLARTGRLDAAIEQFEAAAKAAPDDPVPLRNLATAWERRGDAARAEELRAQAAALRGD